MIDISFRVTVGAHDVAGLLHLPATTPAPCVIACHGLGADKSGEKYQSLARELPAAGLALARFDFRGSGESGGAFHDATIASRIADLEAVLDFLAKAPELDGRFGLIGSSLGGFVALRVAGARRPSLPVVTWNAPANLREIGGNHPQAIEAYGRALVDEVRAGHFVEAPSGASHVLVVQGACDEVVPPAHGRAIHERCAAPSALELIDGADHRLSDASHRARAIDLSRAWLAEHLAAAHTTGEGR